MRNRDNKSIATGRQIRRATTGHFLATLGLMSLLIGVLFSWACQGSQKSKAADQNEKKGKKEKSMTGSAITGGPYEASGVIQVPDTDKVLFVDDSRPGEILLMQIDQSGQQVGTVTSIATGVVVENPEGITTDGTHFYIVGSQANPKRGEANAIARFAFDAAKQTISNVEVIKDFRTLLLAKVADLQGEGAKRGVEGGLNIEGIAWDPSNQRLLLGLRSPIPNGKALLVPLKPRDINGPFTAEHLNFDESRAIPLALGGQGVREIHYDTNLKAFLLISGAPENQEKGDFVLWQWNGAPGGGEPQRKMTLDGAMKPEGVTEFRHGDQRFMFVMGDANRYVKFDY